MIHQSRSCAERALGRRQSVSLALLLRRGLGQQQQQRGVSMKTTTMATVKAPPEAILSISPSLRNSISIKSGLIKNCGSHHDTCCSHLHRSFSTLVSSDSIIPPKPSSSSIGLNNEDDDDAHNNLGNAKALLEDLKRAAAWNHGQKGKVHDTSLWNPDYCRDVVERYDVYLRDLAANKNDSSADEDLLLSSEAVNLAFKALLKCDVKPNVLSERVREWERCLGMLLKQPELTDHLSLRLLTANGKAGNVGRVLSLLHYRMSKGYPARQREFVFAVRSLKAAAWGLRASSSSTGTQTRNIFVGDSDQPAVDNPTRWLDAILLNMHERKFPLTTEIANEMLQCYSASGWTGKASHHFYRVVRQPVNALPADERPENTDNMPKDWCYVPGEGYTYQPIKVKLRYNNAAPPFFKVPSQVRGKVLFSESSNGSSTRTPQSLPGATKNESFQNRSTPDGRKGLFKLERETDPAYSLPLTAAFAFAESLQHGACGHAPVQLNTTSYNALIKACIRRGALWRAMHLLDEVMPAANCQPNNMSYNLVLQGLARVADVSTAQEYYTKMIGPAKLKPDPFTVRAIVDGLLNLGDAPGACSVVQDFFNQHSILPPYTTHIKILEFCLGRDMIYEAKRHVYFIQQLWYWQPNQHHSKRFKRLLQATQENTQLKKPALQLLFSYFGETLHDSDFL